MEYVQPMVADLGVWDCEGMVLDLAILLPLCITASANDGVGRV